MWKLQRQKTFLWLVRRRRDGFALVISVHALFPTLWVTAEVNASRIAAGEYRPLLHAFRQTQEPESVAVWLPLLAPGRAQNVLFEISRSANDGATLEEILAIPPAARAEAGSRGSYEDL